MHFNHTLFIFANPLIYLTKRLQTRIVTAWIDATRRFELLSLRARYQILLKRWDAKHPPLQPR